MEQEELQNLLDSLAEGPLGKPQAYWNKIEAINNTRHKDVRKRVVENTDFKASLTKGWKTRKKNGFVNSGLLNSQVGKRTPIKAYITTNNRRKGENFKFLTKKFYKEYESITAAGNDLKIATSVIHNILNPDHRAFQVKGWYFEDA
tara:strand:- start:52 stop:489 length:438 start_codon:yes stop_codon:yes gene_type:complete